MGDEGNSDLSTLPGHERSGVESQPISISNGFLIAM